MVDRENRGRTERTDVDSRLSVTVLAALVWQHSSRIRDARHQACGHSRCPTRQAPYAGDCLGEEQFREMCFRDGCADIVHDLIARCLGKLTTVTLTAVNDIERYANRLVANEVSDWERHERVARGGPAKPARTDGMPARVNAALAQASGPAERDWLLALFRMVRAYPHRLEPHVGTWPLDGWTAEKSIQAGGIRILGSAAARAEIRADIERVLQIAADVAGPAWVHESIVEPMARRRPQLESTDTCDPVSLEDTAIARLVAADFRTRRSAGAGPRAALAAASERFLGHAPPATAYGECLHLLAAVGES